MFCSTMTCEHYSFDAVACINWYRIVTVMKIESSFGLHRHRASGACIAINLSGLGTMKSRLKSRIWSRMARWTKTSRTKSRMKSRIRGYTYSLLNPTSAVIATHRTVISTCRLDLAEHAYVVEKHRHTVRHTSCSNRFPAEQPRRPVVTVMFPSCSYHLPTPLAFE